MRIHLASLAVASLFVLAGPRPASSQALFEGIPLGDLVRPRPAAPMVTTMPPLRISETVCRGTWTRASDTAAAMTHAQLRSSMNEGLYQCGWVPRPGRRRVTVHFYLLTFHF